MAIRPDIPVGELRRQGRLEEEGHAAVLLNGAGWHIANALEVPANLTSLPLPLILDFTDAAAEADAGEGVDEAA
ncbi:hypothetical protein [Azospirillum endophyticum]